MLISKPEVGKLRPIGIGEAWYRLLGRCILKEIGGEVGELLAPIQMGCGVSGGSEIAARMSQVFLGAHSGHVLIKTDFKNAFNLTPRRLMLEGLQAFCPRLIPWFAGHMANHPHKWTRRVVLSVPASVDVDKVIP